MAANNKAVIINNVVHGTPTFNVPGHLSLGQYMLDQLKENSEDPNRVALVDGETGITTTYRQILQEVVNVATGLKKLGVKRGDVVALCSENRAEYMAATIAVICCGATVTTANLQYTQDEMIHVLNISRPNIIICSESALKLNIKTMKSVSSIKKIIQFNGSPLEKGIIPYSSLVSVQANVNEYEPAEVKGWSDTVLIFYSSGTTGLPKGVMITHLNALYTASTYDLASGRSEKSLRILTLVPWYHAYGLMTTLIYMAMSRTLVYFTGFHPQKYLNAIQKHKINMLILIPPIVVFLAKSPLVEEYDLSSVNVAWCGAAPLSLEITNMVMKRLPNCKGILQGYGMTEATLAITKDLDDENIKSKPGSAGIPQAGLKVKIADTETRKKLGPNQKGEICVKGPVLMKGYAGNKKATENTFDEEGYLKTGDVGYYDEDGYFFIVDRLKELIKYKASQVPPALVENVVLQHSGVAECGVVGAPDEKAGELATAFVVLKPGVNVTEQELLEFTNSRLSKEKRLYGGIIFVNEIPKNASGKILRRVLRQQLKQKRKSKL